MIQYLKNMLIKTKVMWPFHSSDSPLKLTRYTEKFHVGDRPKLYARIKFLNP
jgi:hypothetical protein